MKSLPILILITGLLGLTGCSTPTRVDSGPIRARTFSFIDPGPRQIPAYADTSQRVHAVIQKSITDDLATRGVTLTPKGGDVIVGYLLITGDNASTASINEYFGLRDDAVALQDKAHAVYTGQKNPNHFQAGTLVIDIIDSKTYELLRRGYATRPVLPNLSQDARAALVEQAVNEIFRDLRIKK